MQRASVLIQKFRR